MGIQIRIDSARFSDALKAYQRATGKELGEVVTMQARLMAERLVKLTWPKNSKSGKDKVKSDIQKVYLRSEWWTDTFNFKNEKLDAKVKAAVRSKDSAELNAVFARSAALSKIKIESFDSDRHKAARKNGVVYYKQPYSYPLAQQSQIKKLITEKQKLVGTAKGGWAVAGKAVGGKVPGWLNKSTMGYAVDNSKASSPSVTLVNKSSVFAAMDSKSGIVSRALQGRARDMTKAADRALNEAKRAARL